MRPCKILLENGVKTENALPPDRVGDGGDDTQIESSHPSKLT